MPKLGLLYKLSKGNNEIPVQDYKKKIKHSTVQTKEHYKGKRTCLTRYSPYRSPISWMNTTSWYPTPTTRTHDADQWQHTRHRLRLSCAGSSESQSRGTGPPLALGSEGWSWLGWRYPAPDQLTIMDTCLSASNIDADQEQSWKITEFTHASSNKCNQVAMSDKLKPHYL